MVKYILLILLTSCVTNAKVCKKAKVSSFVCNKTICRIYFDAPNGSWTSGDTLNRRPRVGDTFIKPCRFDYWIKKRIVK